MPGLGNLRFSWTIFICQGVYMQFVCVYFTQTWFCIVLLTNHGLLAYISVLDWYSSKIWLPVIGWLALIAYLIPKSDQSHTIYLIYFFILMNFCHMHCQLFLCQLLLLFSEIPLHPIMQATGWHQAQRKDWGWGGGDKGSPLFISTVS